MTRSACLLLVVVLSCPLSFGQQTNQSVHAASSQLEQLLEDAMAEGREAFLVDALSDLREHPLDVNLASANELCRLPGVGAELARKIVDFRSRTSFSALNELLRVDGMDDALLSALEPFLTVRRTHAPGSTIASVVRMRTRLSRSLADQIAEEKGEYLGTAEKAYNRITANVAFPTAGEHQSRAKERPGISMRLGVLTEKDPGEPDYADFVSGYACVDLPASGIRFILGDFGVDAANGEVFSSSGTFAASGSALHNGGLPKEGVRPSLASESSGNWRGAAASWLGNPLSVSVFASVRPRDATIDSNGAVKAWSMDGYHRTSREISGRHQAREQVFGTRARILLAEGLNLGASLYSLKFNRDVLRPGSGQVPGSGEQVFGLDLAFADGASTFSAEVAQRLGGTRSCVLSYRWSPEKTFTTSLLVRLSGGESVESAVMGIGGSSQNPFYGFGATCSVWFRPAAWMRISGSYDQSRFPRRASTNALPSSGNDMRLNVECKLAKSIELELQYRRKSRPARESLIKVEELERRVDGIGKQTQLRASLIVNVMNWIRSRSRVELSDAGRQFELGIGRGVMMYHEFSFNVLQALSVSLRGIAFETSSYETRIYEFEEDVPGAFQNPALYGKGFRWFLRGEILCGSWLTCSVKYSESDMRPLGLPGTGAATLQLRHDERWSIQLDVCW